MKNIKRIAVYCFIIGMFVVAVVVKRTNITESRIREVPSVISIWEKIGKPVRAKRAEKHEFDRDQKITLVRSDGDIFKGYVTLREKERILPGQDVYIVNDSHMKYGKIVGVSEDVDMATGMYEISSAMSPDLADEKRIIGYIENGSSEEVINVLSDIIDLENGKQYIWKVKDGRAVREEIKIKERYASYAIVCEGIEEGDILITEGQNQIKEGDILNVLE